MDPNFRIYTAPEDEIPPEDKARFDGYLKGLTDAKVEQIAEIEARIEELLRRGVE